MMKLSFILLLCALSLMVDSATVPPSTEDDLPIQYFIDNFVKLCHEADDFWECIQTKLSDFVDHIKNVDEKCGDCRECVNGNIKRVLFNMYFVEHTVRPCKWSESDDHTVETVNELLECIHGKFDSLIKNDPHVSGVEVVEEWNDIQDVVRDCKQQQNKPQAMLTCIGNDFWEKRFDAPECESNDERNTKLYNTLRQLLDRLQK